MKTITKLLLAILCVCLLSACTKEEDSLNNSSQPNTEMKSKDLNRSIPERYVWEEMVYLPIECEGEQIDVLEGYLTSHLVVHYTNGEYLWQNEQFSYKLTSQETKEVFIGKDKFHFDGITWTGAGHTNIRGDKGTHYILHYTWKDWVYTFTKTQCIEKEL